MAGATAGALAGIVVADFSRVLAGPYATMLLGDLGARVIKVERPGAGDDTRAWGPPWAQDGQSTYFHSVNRNKESLALNLSAPEDLAIARNLASRADILIENFKPGTMARYGLAYEELRLMNSRLIWCSITGFGSTAGRDLPGYDLLVQAMGGLMSITGDDEPTKAGVALVDVLTGLHACVSILGALHHRDRTGQGQAIEVTLLGTLLSALVNQASAFVQAGVVSERMGNAHPSIAPYEVYQASDRPIVIAVGNDAQFARMAQVLDHAELANDPRFATNPARVTHRTALNAALNAALQNRTADHWQREFQRVGVPAGPVNDIAQAFALAQSLGLDPIRQVELSSQTSRTVAHPATFSETSVRYEHSAPTLDADGDALRREFST
ncbi:MAG: CoA transferase [Actinomycetales bacterium]|nr:CoA transferase [Actinomycetales bacterium]